MRTLWRVVSPLVVGGQLSLQTEQMSFDHPPFLKSEIHKKQKHLEHSQIKQVEVEQVLLLMSHLIFGRFLHGSVGLEGRHQLLHLLHRVWESSVIQLHHLQSTTMIF